MYLLVSHFHAIQKHSACVCSNEYRRPTWTPDAIRAQVAAKIANKGQGVDLPAASGTLVLPFAVSRSTRKMACSHEALNLGISCILYSMSLSGRCGSCIFSFIVRGWVLHEKSTYSSYRFCSLAATARASANSAAKNCRLAAAAMRSPKNIAAPAT